MLPFGAGILDEKERVNKGTTGEQTICQDAVTLLYCKSDAPNGNYLSAKKAHNPHRFSEIEMIGKVKRRSVRQPMGDSQKRRLRADHCGPSGGEGDASECGIHVVKMVDGDWKDNWSHSPLAKKEGAVKIHTSKKKPLYSPPFHSTCHYWDANFPEIDMTRVEELFRPGPLLKAQK